MTNSSSLSKAKSLMIILMICVGFLMVMSFWAQSHIWFLVGGFIMFIAAGKSYLYLAKVDKVIDQISGTCEELAKGDMEQRLANSEEDGSLGGMINQINKLVDNSDAYIRESSAAMNAVVKGECYRKISTEGVEGAFERGIVAINEGIRTTGDRATAFSQLTDKFEKNVGEIISVLSSSSEELGVSALAMDTDASETSSRASAVALAASDASNNVQRVASTTEELSASIAEISSRIDHSNNIASGAIDKINATYSSMQSLNTASDKIGEVVELITAIAEQTNLLALNATIEAARAGEAGKGFAVVATEVKSLANQTSKATSDISEQITSIQEATNITVERFNEVGQTVRDLNDTTAAISATVDEQSVATREIAESITYASTGTRDVTANIQDVSEKLETTSHSTSSVRETAENMMIRTKQLNVDVADFIRETRVATM